MYQASAAVVAASLWTAACRQPAAAQESASGCTTLIFTTNMYQSEPCHPSCVSYFASVPLSSKHCEEFTLACTSYTCISPKCLPHSC